MIKTIKLGFIIVILILGHKFLSAQQTDVQKLTLLFEDLNKNGNDSIKNLINQKISDELKNNIESYDIADINELKKIKGLFALISSDGKIKVLSWGYSLSDHSNKFSGVVNYYLKESDRYYTEELIQTDKNPENFLQTRYKSNKWYGAVYYNIITQKYKGKMYYLLLGYDGNDDFTNKKLIDALEINEDDFLTFGSPVFDVENSKQMRMVFEYAERLSMILKYDKKLKMIFWDHLSPSKPELKGYYQYYGPDLTYDALVFDKGLWKYTPDVIVNQ
jgi:hypothetical protein